MKKLLKQYFLRLEELYLNTFNTKPASPYFDNCNLFVSTPDEEGYAEWLPIEIEHIDLENKEKFVSPTIYKVARPFLKILFYFLFQPRVKGKENIPREGGVLLCPNHLAAIDVITVGVASPRQITCIAKKELFSIPLLGGLIKALGAVKIDRGGADVGAIKAAVSAIENGRTVVIFPQGHRCPGVNLESTEIRHGAGFISYHAKCDVIPVCINVKKGKYGIFRKTEIIFGAPIRYSSLGFNQGGRDEYAAATKKVFDEIITLGTEFRSLPDYDPSKDRIKNKKRKR